MKIRKYIILILNVLSVSVACAQDKIIDQKELEDRFNFIIATDLGRNGHYDQKPIAEKMGEVAENIGIEFVITSGDTHHYEGIQSISDPLWMTNFELVYSHPELLVEWYPVLGNHEYRGNTQAVIDYSNISRRWCMPDRYYSKSFKTEEGESVLIIFIDTPPLIDKYRNETATYPDAVKQDMQKQLEWIDTTLKNAKEKWKIVVGHHPIYAETSKDDSERTDLQKRLNPILKKYNVDLYICGHIHTFQHIRTKDSKIDYVVNSSGALSRKVKNPIEGTIFSSGETGFSVCSIANDEMDLYLVNKEGNILHKVIRKK
ncbi:MAG: metallophosphoesterase [Dysgonomonas sp.]|nr:metallophosphoesterase [Dysgonomonas sp.]